MMSRCLMGLLAAMAAVGALLAPPASAVDAPIGRLGDTLRVDYNGLIADVNVVSIEPSDVPPGWGYPTRSPHHQVYRADVVVHAVRVPTPSSMATVFAFRGVTLTGDAYEPRNSDAPDALQYALLNAPQGSTVGGAVFWDCYRDAPSSVLLVDRTSGLHLAQWNQTEALP
jgi:hypothetical protein